MNKDKEIIKELDDLYYIIQMLNLPYKDIIYILNIKKSMKHLF